VSATDLTQRPPRSPRVRLGSFILLPRILDKCRAALAGKNGEYKFNCPLDQQFFNHFQLDAEAFKTEVKAGKGDGEMLEWVQKNAGRKPTIVDVIAWSKYQEQRVPGEAETREYFTELHKQAGASRNDISTWFDLLDLDDYVSYGGKA
jgi:hypothetical protein